MMRQRCSFRSVAACLFAGVCLVNLLLTPRIGYGQNPEDGIWPKFRYELTNTGRSPFAGPAVPGLSWQFQTQSIGYASAAISNDGITYIGSTDGGLYALNPDGSRRWRFETASAVFSSPAIDGNGHVYFGADNGTLYVVNEVGALEWSYQVTSQRPIQSSPAVAFDVVYFGSNDGLVHAVVGGGAGAVPLWTFATGGAVFSSPALLYDQPSEFFELYIGSADGSLYALDPNTGALRWAFPTGGAIFSSPAVDQDRTVYVGSDDGSVYAVRNGTQLWRTPTTGPVRSSPALADGVVYVGSEDGNLYALNAATGGIRWAFQTGGAVFSSPAIGNDGTIYVGSNDGRLYALRPSGALVWEYEIGAPVMASPVISDDPGTGGKALAGANTVVVGATDQNVYAIGPRQPLIIESVTPTATLTLNGGEEVVYTTTVVDPAGQPVAGATVEVDDGLLGATFSATPTDGQGQITHQTVVPQGTPDGLYDLVFVARKAGFGDSNPVVRRIRVENRLPGLEVTPQAVNFGRVTLGQDTQSNVTVRNTGTADLNVADIRLTGAHTKDFQIPSLTLPFVVASGGTFVFTIRFRPGGRGVRSATLEVLSDGGNESIPLTGEGVGPDIALDQSNVDFGQVIMGSSADETIRITNTGNENLNLGSFRILGPGRQRFDIVSGDDQGLLGPGATRTVVIRFTPDQTGVQTARLIIPNNAIDDTGTLVGDQEVTLRGEGIVVGFEVTPDALLFENTILGQTAGEQSIEVRNTGSVVLSMSMALEGTDAGAFAIVSGGETGPLPPGGPPRTVVVQFAPTRAGQHVATLRIQVGTGEATVALAGTGITASIGPPELTGVPTAGQPLGIRVPFSEGFNPVERQLFYRRTGESVYRSVDMTVDGTALLGTIPAEAMTERGAEYYVRASNGVVVLTLPETDFAGTPIPVRVRVELMTAGGTFLPEVYRMISVPLDLDDPSIAGVLGGAYGDYDPERWRVLRWRPDPARPDTGQYDEYTDGLTATFTPGTAFWLITSGGEGFTVGNGTSVDASRSFTLRLDPGWTQIASPFAFRVAVSSITSSGPIQGPHYYDGQLPYQLNVRELVPWEGYFVLNPNTTAVTLTIPPVEAGTASKRAQSEPLFPDADFMLQLQAEIEGASLRDTENYVGFAEDVAERRHALNLVEPPAVGDHLRLSILNDGTRYASYFQPAGEEGRQWDLEIAASVPSERRFRERTVTVSLVEQGQRPAGYDLYLLDRDLGRVIPVESGRFTLVLTEALPVRHLSLIVGFESFAEAHNEGISLVPVEYVLEQNYPNPFNPETVIRYGLNRRSRVELDIYNVLGQRVRTLVAAEQPGGRYEVVWDGRDDGGRAVASGLYIYQLRADAFTTSRKMLLLR
ncbi:MAG: PQQ-binding-like beta-propeller repeat protein [Rhodothermales bacterium]